MHASVLATSSLALLALPSIAQEGRALPDESLEPLVESIRAWREARTEGAELEERTRTLAGTLETLAEAAGTAEPLRLALDIGRALTLSRDEGRWKPKTGKVAADAFEAARFGADGLAFAYRTPKDYDPEERVYPLVVSLPDAGERLEDHLRDAWTDRELFDEVILVCPALPADTASWPAVMVAGEPGGLTHVLTALRLATERFAVDFERVFVAGHGDSVPAALAAANHAPQAFAGVLGRGESIGTLGPDNFGTLSVRLVTEDEGAAAFVAGAAEGSLVLAEEDPAAQRDWIREHARDTNPREVTVQTGTPFPTRVHWLRIAPMAPGARATAKMDRDADRVEVETEGASLVTLYLNDALLDLSRPVTVVVDGVEHEREARRSLATTLDLVFDGTSDPASVYVAELAVDATEARGLTLDDMPLGEDAEYAERYAAAEDVEALWELHDWCRANEREGKARRALRRIIRLVPDDERAHQALGHVLADGIWFPSQAALDRHRARQDPDTAKQRGLVLHKSLWMHPSERSFANKGWTKDPFTGEWLSGGDLRRLEEGWARQDLAWIEPDEVHHVDEGLWRVDGEWLEIRTANRRHARIDSMWVVPSPEVVLHSTADRDVTLAALSEMQVALVDLAKVFGAEPVLPLDVALMRDEEQYDRLAFGDPDGRRPATNRARTHLVTAAFFADSWFERREEKESYRGMGVGYWDALAPNGAAFGRLAARLAVGLSYAYALDPSPKAEREGPSPEFHADWRAEKLLPEWLLVGGAVYAERYFEDGSVGGDGDPWWTRSWSLGALRDRGGLRPLAELLAFELDPGDRDDAQKLLIEAGLVVAFIVDGGCAPVDAAHAELKRALAAGRVGRKHVEDLVEAITTHEAELRAFAAE